MSLTLGSLAPFGRPTGGQANFPIPAKPAHLLYLHELPQRIRGVVDGTVVADTEAARMLHETRMLPQWYLPREDVVGDLEASDTSTHCPFKGDARYWHLRVGDRLVPDAFWEYAQPLPDCPPIAGLLAPDLGKLTSWMEEDEPVVGHPRDPFHRVDLRRSSRPVIVRLDGRVVARTRSPLAVHETGLPTRWYLPIGDVEAGLLVRSTTTTTCPYKGVAAYWSAGDVADAAWGYPEPLAGAERLVDLVCFAEGERITLEVGR
jgi:uncharacterized protein (DUF427 family)